MSFPIRWADDPQHLPGIDMKIDIAQYPRASRRHGRTGRTRIEVQRQRSCNTL